LYPFGTICITECIKTIATQELHAATRKHLYRFVKKVIDPGSVVHTDGASAYEGLEQFGYAHDRTVLLGRKDKNAASKLLPRVHRVASLLKRWLLGTHQGAVSAEHLEYYLDEFSFRFNCRTSRSRGKLFYRLLQQAVQITPTTYQSMGRTRFTPKSGRARFLGGGRCW
jgi:transposase-like protein